MKTAKYNLKYRTLSAKLNSVARKNKFGKVKFLLFSTYLTNSLLKLTERREAYDTHCFNLLTKEFGLVIDEKSLKTLDKLWETSFSKIKGFDQNAFMKSIKSFIDSHPTALKSSFNDYVDSSNKYFKLIAEQQLI